MISIEYAKSISNQSIKESWELMLNILKENGLGKFVGILKEPPKVYWNKLDEPNVAGYYHYPRGKHPQGQLIVPFHWSDYIEMNIDFLTSPDAEEFIWETSKHELGHCINWRLNKRKHHDQAFRAIMRAIGGDPSTFHNYGTNDVQKKKGTVQFQCGCGEKILLSPLQLKRALKGVYLCKRCEANLKHGKIIE